MSAHSQTDYSACPRAVDGPTIRHGRRAPGPRPFPARSTRAAEAGALAADAPVPGRVGVRPRRRAGRCSRPGRPTIDGELAGWASAVRGKWFPPGIAMINVTVAQAHERRGRRRRALPGNGRRRCRPRSRRSGRRSTTPRPTRSTIARAYGFEVTQHGIESELALVDLPTPERRPGRDLRGRLVARVPRRGRGRGDAHRQPDQSRGGRGLREHADQLPRDRGEGRAAGLARSRGSTARPPRSSSARSRTASSASPTPASAGRSAAAAWPSRSSSTATCSPPRPARPSATP